MLQRIQTVYLLLVAVLMGVTAVSPLAIFKDVQGNFLVLESLGVFFEGQKAYPTWGIVSVAGFSALLSFLNIFQFKNRKKQIKLCAFNTILILFLYVTIATYLYFGQRALVLTFESVQYGVVLPVIALIFNVLALVKIKADEKLVRSLDRIR